MTYRIIRFTLRMFGGALTYLTLPIWGPLVLILVAALEAGGEISKWVSRVWKESAE